MPAGAPDWQMWVVPVVAVTVTLLVFLFGNGLAVEAWRTRRRLTWEIPPVLDVTLTVHASFRRSGRDDTAFLTAASVIRHHRRLYRLLHGLWHRDVDWLDATPVAATIHPPGSHVELRRDEPYTIAHPLPGTVRVPGRWPWQPDRDLPVFDASLYLRVKLSDHGEVVHKIAVRRDAQVPTPETGDGEHPGYM